MSKPQPYFVVDAFTDRPFAGNPAAVVPLESWPADAWLRQVAMEMNLSETAFIVPSAAGYDLRWFTPAVEVDLCGHATLATARVLVELGKLPDGGEVSFSSRSGILKAARRGELLELDFPVKPETPAEPPPGLVESLGLVDSRSSVPRYVGKNKFDFLLELETAEAVRAIKPDFKRLAGVECRGIIITARGDDGRHDFISRFFAPQAGIDEDPVTGSAHCCLADFWSKRLGKTKFAAYQASRRGGELEVELCGERVLLRGRAVLTARGELLC